MKVRYLIWDKINLKHVARHRFERYEVDEAILTGKPSFRKWKGQNRYYAYGRTEAGRYLFVVLEDRGKGQFYVVTARDMVIREKRLYHKAKK